MWDAWNRHGMAHDVSPGTGLALIGVSNCPVYMWMGSTPGSVFSGGHLSFLVSNGLREQNMHVRQVQFMGCGKYCALHGTLARGLTIPGCSDGQRLTAGAHALGAKLQPVLENSSSMWWAGVVGGLNVPIGCIIRI